MKKVMRIGSVKEDPRDRQGRSIYFVLEHKHYGWSFIGVIGPTPKGNALSCGQIHGAFVGSDAWIKMENIRFAKGWNEKRLRRYLAIWNKYHMTEAVPQKVLDWLDNLPEADRPLPGVWRR